MAWKNIILLVGSSVRLVWISVFTDRMLANHLHITSNGGALGVRMRGPKTKATKHGVGGEGSPGLAWLR